MAPRFLKPFLPAGQRNEPHIPDPMRTPTASPQCLSTGDFSPHSWDSSPSQSSYNADPFAVITAPSWAQDILRQEQNTTDTTCFGMLLNSLGVHFHAQIFTVVLELLIRFLWFSCSVLESLMYDYSVYVNVYSRGRLLCDIQADLQHGLLIYR